MEFWRFIGNSSDFITPLTGSYNIFLVLLSSLTASFSAYAALSVVDRAQASKKRLATLTWLAVGAFAMGSGIWAMHFVGMLAFQLPVAVAYTRGGTLLSVAPAVGASCVVLYVRRTGPSRMPRGSYCPTVLKTRDL